MKIVHLTINYEVARKEKFQSFLYKFQKENGLVFDIQRLARYEKFPEQFQANISLELPARTSPELVFECLQLANKFKTSPGATVSVLGPNENDDELSFEVILNQESPNNPVKWLHIQTV
ncbi:hypothetical protein BFP97_16935 [Roseivirga sp. 4D4]|uniref:hypothetical protein n=1 Tax=Roseivirga sp. 4D4 TaxID=1889784 RepID=UPI000852C321|nr:hypothetical protein [Roseivirga sp. 4D4]OEK03102.1 hypothetical protein BFP97_16935 [Roseivirga sp. 4D4]